jgi:hypothetical protein
MQYIYVGNLTREKAVEYMEILLGGYQHDYQFKLYESSIDNNGKQLVYAVVDVKTTDKVKYLIERMKSRKSYFIDKDEMNIRQFIIRNQKNDRRRDNYNDVGRRKTERRVSSERLIYCSEENYIIFS